MKRSEINHKQRYLAKIGGERTIVKAYQVRGTNDLLCRDERTGKTIRLSSRRLWRPAMDDERWDCETVQSWDYRTQVEMWDGEDVCLPATECENMIVHQRHKTVGEECYDLAISESRQFFLSRTAC